ncbi:hypothetical protein N657DRAFT_646632 [Parathielavia appendiculata]|uniref:Uncharacterized protein n=1 Tax=Parathielavia appendiculata TaxID=2587402 RepID=A0AAN6Z2W3_9PEZI|nr:hypothetical protein N657DRAFT_646632 [Parathielavia appendiculata]
MSLTAFVRIAMRQFLTNHPQLRGGGPRLSVRTEVDLAVRCSASLMGSVLHFFEGCRLVSTAEEPATCSRKELAWRSLARRVGRRRNSAPDTAEQIRRQTQELESQSIYEIEVATKVPAGCAKMDLSWSIAVQASSLPPRGFIETTLCWLLGLPTQQTCSCCISNRGKVDQPCLNWPPPNDTSAGRTVQSSTRSTVHGQRDA